MIPRIMLFLTFAGLVLIGFAPKMVLSQTSGAGQVRYIADANACFQPLPPLCPCGAGPGQDPLTIVKPKSKAIVLRLEDFPNSVTVTHVNPDGRMLVTESSNNEGLPEVRLWAVPSGQLLSSWLEYTAPIFGPNGQLLAMVNKAGAIEVWNINSNTLVSTISTEIPTDRNYGYTLSPDGKMVAVINRGEAKFFDRPKTTEEEFPVPYVYEPNWVDIWDVSTSQKIQHLEGKLTEQVVNGSKQIGVVAGHSDTIGSVAFSPNGEAIVTAGADGTLRLWDVATGQHLRCFSFDDPSEIEGMYEQDIVVAFSSDGRSLANNDGAQSVYTWNAITGQQTGSLNLAQMMPISEWVKVAFSPDLKTLLALSQDELVRRWDIKTGRLTGVLPHPIPLEVHTHNGSVEFSPNSKLIAVTLDYWANNWHAVWVWDANHKDLTQAATTEAIVVEGIQMAQQGDITGALARFTRAQVLNPFPDHDLRLSGGLRALDSLLPAHDIKNALLLTTFMNRIDSSVPKASILNELCWDGSLRGFAAEVLPICERAVALTSADEDTSNDINTRDSRGLARALLGDYQGALEDFEFFVTNSSNSSYVESRQAWVAALKAGRNPFDEATLAQLRGDNENNPSDSSEAKNNIQNLLTTWDEVHRAALADVSTDQLSSVLSGAALQQQLKTINDLKKSKCAWIINVLEAPVLVDIAFISATEAVAKVRKNWDMDIVCKGKQNESPDSDGPFLAIYTLKLETDGWRIVKKESQDSQ